MMMSESDIKSRRGDALRAARRQAMLSARELADRVNSRSEKASLTDHAIYSYERGRVLLGRDVARRLAAVLDVPLAELLVGDPEYGLALRDRTEDRLLKGEPSLLLREAFMLGRMAATAEDLVEPAARIRPAVTVLADLLRGVYGPTVEAAQFSRHFTDLLRHLKFIADSGAAGRVERDPSRYEDVADLLGALTSLRGVLEGSWGDLMRFTRRPDDDQAHAIDVCRKTAAELDRVGGDLEDCVGRCRRFIGGTLTVEPDDASAGR